MPDSTYWTFMSIFTWNSVNVWIKCNVLYIITLIVCFIMELLCKFLHLFIIKNVAHRLYDSIRFGSTLYLKHLHIKVMTLCLVYICSPWQRVHSFYALFSPSQRQIWRLSPLLSLQMTLTWSAVICGLHRGALSTFPLDEWSTPSSTYFVEGGATKGMRPFYHVFSQGTEFLNWKEVYHLNGVKDKLGWKIWCT